MIAANHRISPRLWRVGVFACVLLCACLLCAAISASPVRASGFGFEAGPAGFDGSITNADGSPDVQAGSHPYQVTTSFHFNLIADAKGNLHTEGGDWKDVETEVPPGLIGDINAVPICSEIEFFLPSLGNPRCNDNTVVGILHVNEKGGTGFYVPLFNLQPSAGVAAVWGAMIQAKPILLTSAVRSGSDYGVTVSSTDISQLLPLSGSTVTIWGVPADPRHDPLRGINCLDFDTGASKGSCPAKGVVPTAYLTLPTSCAGPQEWRIRADSWASPEQWATDSFITHEGLGNQTEIEGCERLQLTPELNANLTTDSAETPSGLDFNINIADEGLTAAGGLAEPQINKTVVTLPEGVTVNPSAGEGLSACSPSDYHRETVDSPPGAGCPDSSNLGEVTIESPLLSQPVKGSLFLAEAAPNGEAGKNPFNSLLVIYMVAKLPERGILIKLAGKVEPNPITGRLTTTFENVPQLPFSHFHFHFREGQSAPLASPPACGSYTVQAALTPWSAPEEPRLFNTPPFAITKGVHGGACPSGGIPPFKPQVISGTQNNAAGSYSPFYLRIIREDGEQELTRFSTTLPPGLTGNLTGIPFCPEADIEAARAREVGKGHAGGREELNAPSCPPASQVGHTLVGAGVGSILAQNPGRVYLAGPYQGAPLSLVSITSATVGPFDLGTVVIRFGLRINPVTAQVEVDASSSDPIPHIIDGVVVHVRDIRVYINREKFIVNPTNCDSLSIADTIDGAGADFANPADQVPVAIKTPFQAADCSSLGFKPTFKASTGGKTSRANGASLSVKLAYPVAPAGSQANIKRVKVELPKLLPSRLTTLQKACTEQVFNTDPASCPAPSVIGRARALTPILPVPLEGPAYFVSHGGAKFPELIVVLQGYGVTIDLHGETFISKRGITSSTFAAVPDQPVTSFELTLPSGPYSALAANGNLCKSSLTMPTEFTAQNGAMLRQLTHIAVEGCPKSRHRKKARHTD
ncbi:MAG TPA: hypothetical protein VNY52_03030 [Solirubrobacteraceae bacterium]|jgi:hypothetical protein|nr:hypothetical protein [Solirubrobacteraceae bacterium]